MSDTVPERDWEEKCEAPPNPHRRLFADACRQSSWQNVKMIAADCGVSPSYIENMNAGATPSYAEQVARWTARSLREGMRREDALAQVYALMDLFVIPDDLKLVRGLGVLGASTDFIAVAAGLVQKVAHSVADGELSADEAKPLLVFVKNARRRLAELEHAIEGEMERSA